MNLAVNLLPEKVLDVVDLNLNQLALLVGYSLLNKNEVKLCLYCWLLQLGKMSHLPTSACIFSFRGSGQHSAGGLQMLK